MGHEPVSSDINQTELFKCKKCVFSSTRNVIQNLLAEACSLRVSTLLPLNKK